MPSPRSLASSVVIMLALAGSSSIAACQPSLDPSVDTGPVTTTQRGETSGDGDPGDGDGDGDPDGPVCVSALDVLLVVDNSGSMGEEQARLATAISGLIDPLDAAGVDWRIGVTTTDNGNEWCPGTTPEAGKLVLSHCKSRSNDFLFNNGSVDARDIACNDVCPLGQGEIEILPTATQYDNTEQPRPWIEKIDGVTNLAGDLDPATALGCLLPMGINGCGFESQLESAYLSLARAENEGEFEYGFLRPGASLLVIIVSDEVDCSYNKSYAEIFEQDGNKVFWSDPSATFPTSAVCWNAGVECTGDPSAYASCDPVNKDVDGNANVADADAVLHPLSRYRGKLDDIESDRQQTDPSSIVRASLIAGAALDGSLSYVDVSNTDPEYQNSFGIGPGCNDGDSDSGAVPPVRMRELATHTSGSIHSICANEYASALADIVEPFIAECG